MRLRRFALNDGTFQMQSTRGAYPYGPGKRPNWDLEAPFFEPLTLLPALAMQYRDPLLHERDQAPAAPPLSWPSRSATAAIMSGDRFALGVGASWAPEEYEFCGVDWARRGRGHDRVDRGAAAGAERRVVSYHGGDLHFGPLVARPAPRAPVKIIFGGHQDPSLRRAARLADGWIGSGPVASFEELGHRSSPAAGAVRPSRPRLGPASRSTPRPGRCPRVDAYRRLEATSGITDAVMLPTNAGGEPLIDEPTRQRLRGEPVVAALDPARAYSTEPPAAKVDAVRRFADGVLAAWR